MNPFTRELITFIVRTKKKRKYVEFDSLFMLYMTLIVAMLVLIYKYTNNTEYKTAKLRMTMKIRDLSIAMIVVQCGGNPSLYFKT